MYGKIQGGVTFCDGFQSEILFGDDGRSNNLLILIGQLNKNKLFPLG